MAQLLLVEDEKLLRWALHKRLEKAGHTVQDAGTLAEAEQYLRAHRPQVVLLDVNLPDGNGIDFLAAQQERLFESRVIVFTADGSIEDAVRAMKLGAWDFLSKPIDQEELLNRIQKASARHRELQEAETARRAREKQSKMQIVAESAGMKGALQLASTVAGAGSTTVLVTGETGAGKEVIARYIHANSPRANAPLQALNCAAIPEHLVESELFGYEKGAFTDAKNTRKGLFELADGGTVVLDEIGEIPHSLQAKLLRFLEERSLRRLGATREIAVDVRIIALTNRDLRARVASGHFREDLYYRLNVFPISVPPLRERREDIIPLALDFALQFGAASRKKFKELSPELKKRLLVHPWTGNVRELRNVIERAVILEDGDVLHGYDLLLGNVQPFSTAAGGAREDTIVPLDEVEFVMVQRALRAAKGNQSQAARLLKVSRDQLRYRVKRYREEGRLEVDAAEEAC
ncbi:MAG: sigma-54-dependent Fis family transcriptional regulator [Thermoanaerobaculia bacterium]|nr:sigma-54-dependent Fis family transcriptional regulator [Thermoanaerobaculia bacterium]